MRSPLLLSLGVVALAMTAVAACAGGGAGDTTTPASTTDDGAPTTPAPPSTTVAATTSGAPSTTGTATTTEPTARTEPPPFQEVTVLVPSAGEMGAEWDRSFVIPYGTTPETLGTAPGGDDGSLDLGPEYGVQTADGTWWFLDSANRRIAHFSGTGEYLDDVAVPEDLLVNGYFQYQIPKALDDGTVVATGFRGEEQTALLIVDDGEVSGATLPGTLAPRATDGTRLFMEDAAGTVQAVRPRRAAAEPVEWMVARGGARYSVERDGGDSFVVSLPDAAAGLERRLVFRWAEDPSVPVFGGIEVDSGLDNTLFFYLTGGAELDPENVVQAAGFFSISSDGTVSPVESTIDPFSPSDPGSPARLGVRPRTAAPWLMFVLGDGVHVYTRRTG